MHTDPHAFPMIVLGHTLKQYRVNARNILFYLPNHVSKRTLGFIKAAGWELHPVTLIPPHRRGKGIHHTFIDQYTKFSIWTFDEIGIKTVLYLDAATIVRRNFDELPNLPFGFRIIWVETLGSRQA